MKIAIQQPHFLPWPAYWHKVLEADAFLLWSGVYYSKGEYINRIRHAGAWLTLPVVADLHTLIVHTTIADEQRRLDKIAKAVEQTRGTHRNRLEQICLLLRQIRPGDNLAGLNFDLLCATADAMGADAGVFVDVPMQVLNGTKTEKLRVTLDAYAPHMTEYLTGVGARDYLDPAEFGDVPVRWQDPSGYDPEMSVVQLIANEPDPIDYIRSRGKWE